jgi:hypothetical protein
MTAPSLFQQIFARDPRKIARLPEIPVDRALAELRKLCAAQTEAAPSSVTPPVVVAAVAAPAADPAADDALGAALGNLATHVWRAKNRMVDAKTGLPHDDMKRAFRHIEAAMETLRQMDVTTNDWLNQSYDAGLPVKVLTFQPTPGVERDTIVEAIRPAVVWKNQLLQLGEVVVGIPEPAATAAAKSP